MSKICAKCSKAVYPLEELKCLEKIWHKGCFKCWECGMTLSMKNYKGYDKKPYCVAHYPQTKATVVADTPEMARIAHNTKIQSQVKYHEEFEKMKGTKIEVADDPEMRRVKRIASVVSEVEYKGLREKTVNTEARRQSVPHASQDSTVESASSNADYKPSPYSDRSASHSTVYVSSGAKVSAPPKRVGSIADYDPMNENYGSLTHGYHPTSRTNSMSQEWEETVPLSPSAAIGQPAEIDESGVSDDTGTNAAKDESAVEPLDLERFNPQDSDASAAISHEDAVELDEPTTEAHDNNEDEEKSVLENDHQPDETAADQKQMTTEAIESSEAAVEIKANVYRAVYSYEAQDEDEVGFEEGDLILDAEFVAEGWMTGTVKKTGRRGMMPSNYVEAINEDDE